MKYDVFISYRREGGAEIASAVKNYLEKRDSMHSLIMSP